MSEPDAGCSFVPGAVALHHVFLPANQEIKDILGIPPQIFMECAIFLGHADEKLGDPKRRPVPEVSHLNGWGNRYELTP